MHKKIHLQVHSFRYERNIYPVSTDIKYVLSHTCSLKNWLSKVYRYENIHEKLKYSVHRYSNVLIIFLAYKTLETIKYNKEMNQNLNQPFFISAIFYLSCCMILREQKRDFEIFNLKGSESFAQENKTINRLEHTFLCLCFI